MKAKIEQLVKELKSNPLIESVEVNIPPPASRDFMNTNRKVQHITLPDEILDFYSQMDGFKIEWKPTSEFENGYAYGYAEILPFDQLLYHYKVIGDLSGLGLDPAASAKEYRDKPAPPNFFGSDEQANDLELIYHWRRYLLPVEEFVGGVGSGGGMAGLYFGKPGNPMIYLMGPDIGVAPTGHSFSEYIDTMIKAKCVNYWQYSISPISNHGTPGLEEDFRKIFGEKLSEIAICKTTEKNIKGLELGSPDPFVDTFD